MKRTITLGQRGHVTVPADIRDWLGRTAGDELTMRVDGSSLLITRWPDALVKLQALTRDVEPGRSLVDELLAERRSIPG